MWGWSASSVGVERGGGGGYRVKGGLRVDRQAGQAGVPDLGHQNREPGACFGEVGEPEVAELVQGPAAAGRRECLGGSPVGQPGPAGGGVEIGQSCRAGWRAGAGAISVRNRPYARFPRRPTDSRSYSLWSELHRIGTLQSGSDAVVAPTENMSNARTWEAW